MIRALRLRNQGLVAGVTEWDSVADAAAGMVAMQAQDPKGVLWALASRTRPRPDEDRVASAFASGAVVRNRPSRGTLQVTAPQDIGWLSALMTPRSTAAALKRRHQIGVTEQMIQGVGEVLVSELSGGRTRTRPELVEACAAAGIQLDGTQAGHVLRHHTEVMTIVFAGSSGRSDSFALADEWVTDRRQLERSDALAELATRYFTSRGPATAKCLSWWGNLTMGDVRSAIDAAGDALEEIEIDGTAFFVAAESAELSESCVEEALAEPLLLAPFDEYLLGYRSRDAVVTPEHLDAVVPGRNGMFKPIVVVEGEVVGTWSRKMTAKKVTVTLEPFDRLGDGALEGLTRRAEEYGAFLGLPATMAISRS